MQSYIFIFVVKFVVYLPLVLLEDSNVQGKPPVFHWTPEQYCVSDKTSVYTHVCIIVLVNV